ncbi:hypothetical protein ACFL6K_00990 [Candidatus Latescibacterota bacterium]
MVTFENADDILPICPHCKNEISKILYQAVKEDLGKRVIYFCPECRSSLGVSQRKGLTFGC